MLEAIDNYLCYVDPDTGEPMKLCEEIRVVERRIDLLTGDITLLMSLWVRGKEQTFEIDRGELDRTLPAKFFKQGLTILPTQDNVEVLLDFILETDQVAPNIYYHKALGFRQVDGKGCFLANYPVGNLPKPLSESRYYNPAVTAPLGTLDSWLNVMKKEVVGHPNLELALAIGASAPVAYLLREEKAFAEVPIWALIGPSSTGKTTALRLMASVFGSPEEGDGLIRDLNATENAFFRGLGDNSGLPLLIDEATCKASWDFSSIVYNLSKGKDKGRCKNTGELRERMSFSGAINY